MAYARRRLLSPLTLRVLAINILALAILVGGLLYLGQYRESLFEAKVAALSTNGAIIAGALGEGAVGGAPESIALHVEIATDFVRRLSQLTGTRVRLVDEGGALVADSRVLLSRDREVRARMLVPPVEVGGISKFLGWVADFFADLLPLGRPLPLYREPVQAIASEFPEVLRALEGEPASAQRRTADGRVIVTVALPVQRFKKVLGALLLSASGEDIEAGVREVRLAILQVFVLAFAITVMLSIYLAATIARPIRRLAEVADIVRRGPNRRVQIPDFTSRRDEIGELSGALGDMTAALYDRIEAIEAFAADVAHEVRNPITSIRSAVELLAQGGDADRQQKLTAIIQDDVARLDRLIGDIADASRVDAELARAETVDVDLMQLVWTLVGIQRETGGSDAPRIDVDTGSESPLVIECIEGRLGQVMRNLLDNAITFSPTNGRILIRVSRDEGLARITVEDEGPGIPEDMSEAIFDRFYSERPESEAFGSHSGLGLSISRQIVAAHGGNIRAENRRDESGDIIGARFIVTLPLPV
ncbi:MAG: histidine kinase [Alphaproteobacteria bacterium]|nr:histidine kinase [Alphaproteobacteria bacterium]